MPASRRLLTACVAAVLIAGYSGLWLYAERRLEHAILSRIEDARRQGSEIRFSGISFHGFPFALAATADDVRVVRPDGLAWEAGRIAASAHPWSWRRVHVELPRGQRLMLAGTPGMTATAEAGRGDLVIDGAGRMIGADLVLESVALALPGATGIARTSRVTGRWAEREPDGGGSPIMTVGLAIDALSLPGPWLPALGQDIAHARLNLTVSGPLPSTVEAREVAAWRDAGGLVAIDMLSLDWGPLSITGSGTFVLDSALQPSGRLIADIRGFAETVDALVDAGIVESRPATFAKAGLSLLAVPSEDGRGPVLTAPFAIENRQLALGPLPLGSLPEIAWPDRPPPLEE